MVRSIENEDPPPVSVASPMRCPAAFNPAMSNRPDPMKVFDVGQWIRLASDLAQAVFFARFQMDGVAVKPAPAQKAMHFISIKIIAG